MIKKGDRILIASSGVPRICIVDTATNYGTPTRPDWYIEGRQEADNRAIYWKQGIDGGTVTKL